MATLLGSRVTKLERAARMNALVRYEVTDRPDDEADPFLDAIDNRLMTVEEWSVWASRPHMAGT